MGLLSSIRGSEPAKAPETGSPTTVAGKKEERPVTLKGQSLLRDRPCVGDDSFSLVADSGTFEKFGFRLS